MKSSGERKFHKFNAKFKPAFCQYYVLVAQLKYTKNLYQNWIFR